MSVAEFDRLNSYSSPEAAADTAADTVADTATDTVADSASAAASHRHGIVHPYTGHKLNIRRVALAHSMLTILYLLCSTGVPQASADGAPAADAPPPDAAVGIAPYVWIAQLLRFKSSLVLKKVVSTHIPLLVDPALRILKAQMRYLGTWKRTNLPLVSMVYALIPSGQPQEELAWIETPELMRRLRGLMEGMKATDTVDGAAAGQPSQPSQLAGDSNSDSSTQSDSGLPTEGSAPSAADAGGLLSPPPVAQGDEETAQATAMEAEGPTHTGERTGLAGKRPPGFLGALADKGRQLRHAQQPQQLQLQLQPEEAYGRTMPEVQRALGSATSADHDAWTWIHDASAVEAKLKLMKQAVSDAEADLLAIRR